MKKIDEDLSKIVSVPTLRISRDYVMDRSPEVIKKEFEELYDIRDNLKDVFAVSFKNKTHLVKRQDLFNIRVNCPDCSFNADFVSKPNFGTCRRRKTSIPKESLNYLKQVINVSKSHAKMYCHTIEIDMVFPKSFIIVKPSVFNRLKHILIELYWSICS